MWQNKQWILESWGPSAELTRKQPELMKRVFHWDLGIESINNKPGKEHNQKTYPDKFQIAEKFQLRLQSRGINLVQICQIPKSSFHF